MKSVVLLLFALAGVAGLRAQARFVDCSTEGGFRQTGLNRGLAVADYDGDGREDVFLSRLNGPCLLFRNEGPIPEGVRFSERSAEAGLATVANAMAAVWGDLDNDGWTDLVVGGRNEPTRIFRNRGDGTFEEKTSGSGLRNDSNVQAALLADVDNDGLLDVYLGNLAAENALFRNKGNWKFENISARAGLNIAQLAMGAVFFDYDNDGDQDLYQTFDNRQPFRLFRNDGKGSFSDVSQAAGVDYPGFGMGVDVGDADNDGFLDLYITNLYENVLFRNQGDGAFANISTSAGVADRGMGWGTVWLDYDNDGRQDIYVSNDTYFPVDQKNYENVLYHNLGELRFDISSRQTELSSPYAGYAAASADLDGNGFPDLLIANSGQDGNQILLNRQPDQRHWVILQLQGVRCNRSAIGARVVLESGSRRWSDELNAGSGYAAQNSMWLHFGLDQDTLIERLTVYWPGGEAEVFENLAVDRRHLIRQFSTQTTSRASQVENVQAFQLFPNPSQGAFSLSFSLLYPTRRLALRLCDARGRLLATNEVGPLGSGEHTIDWSPAGISEKGIYFLKWQTEKQGGVQRLIIQR